MAFWALVLNLGWELAQSPLNTCPARPRTWLRAASVDALLTVAAGQFAAAGGRRSTATRWSALVAGLAATALAVELHALASGRWAYTAAMPTIGGVGIVPLVQLPALGATSHALARRRARRPARSGWLPTPHTSRLVPAIWLRCGIEARGMSLESLAEA